MDVELDTVLREVVAFLEIQTKGRIPISADTDMAKDLNLDSLAVMDLLMALEDKFDVSLPLNNLAEIRTVSDLASSIVDLKKSS